MTNEDRLKAFEMHLNGVPWAEIGKALGYSSSTIFSDLRACVAATHSSGKRCVYPAIWAYIADRCGGSIREFADQCGMPYGSVYNAITGRDSVSLKRRRRMAEVVGLPVEEAFTLSGERPAAVPLLRSKHVCSERPRKPGRERRKGS